MPDLRDFLEEHCPIEKNILKEKVYGIRMDFQDLFQKKIILSLRVIGIRG